MMSCQLLNKEDDEKTLVPPVGKMLDGNPSTSSNTTNRNRNCFRIMRRLISICIWITVFVTVTCSFLCLFPVEKLPFPCDRSKAIMRPFYGDTIPVKALFSSVFILPTLLFILIEVSDMYTASSRDRRNSLWKRYSTVASDFYAGLIYLTCVIEMLKLLVHELRPHFFYSCRPDWSTIKCVDGMAVEYNCTGEEYLKLGNMKMDIYKSFPSGHAALSVYMASFVCVYLHFRLPPSHSLYFLRAWIQLLLLFYALAFSITRVTDNRHYWWDVLGGAIVGFLVFIYMICCVPSTTFGTRRRKKERSEKMAVNPTESESSSIEEKSITR